MLKEIVLKKTLASLSILLPLYACAAEVENIHDLFSKGNVHGNIKYYFIETNKENSATNLETRAYAHSIGGKLNYTTAELSGISMGISLMTTNPFSLPDRVDTSIIARDDGIRLENSISGDIAQEGFSVLGESFVRYRFEDLEAWYGRKVIKTPLIHAKEVRIIPSSVEGGRAFYTVDEGLKLGLGYISGFKQRTSSRFINILEHALGSQMKEIIGKDKGYVIPLSLVGKNLNYQFQIYDYYADDFMNTLYLDASYKHQIKTGFGYELSLQGMYQNSIGHSKDAMNVNPSAYGGKIDAKALGAKINVHYGESALGLAYSTVFDGSANEHNSLVTPWDGTPLFTNTITSSNLFSSNYGSGLKSSAGYISGTQGVKLSYKQKYEFLSLKGVKSLVTYAYFDNSDFAEAQEDINAVLSYTRDSFSLALKGIWGKNSTSNGASDTQASISQLDRLWQYRVIANYNF